jgi:hypothetical protein
MWPPGRSRRSLKLNGLVLKSYFAGFSRSKLSRYRHIGVSERI